MAGNNRRSGIDPLLLLLGLVLFGPVLAAMAVGSFEQMKAILNPYVKPVLLIVIGLVVLRELWNRSGW